MNLITLIHSDYKKYKRYGGHFLSIIFFTQGFWAVFQYRVAHFIYKKIKVPILRQLLLVITLFWQKTIEIITGISIPASVQIGHSFYIGHFGNIILNAKVRIGFNCNVSQGVTIGVSGLAEKRGVPVIGNNVYIGANCVIAGKIEVGDEVLIGACSLVTANVPSCSVMLGVPAVKVSENGSKGYI